jgi:hypothetical protein
MVVDKAISVLNEQPKLNIVDVGCNTGTFLNYTKPLLKVPSFWIGIDPSNLGASKLYDLYLNKAISNVKEDEKAIFTEYNDSGCNSLLDMNTDIITHEKGNDEKWFIDRIVEQVVLKKEVVVTSLERVCDTISNFKDDIIHYVKVDTQGNDIKVAKSLGKYLSKTMFIQLECVTSHNPKKVLYKGQQLLEHDIDDMRLLGFTMMNMEDYAGFASPEGDVLFVNNNCL